VWTSAAVTHSAFTAWAAPHFVNRTPQCLSGCLDSRASRSNACRTVRAADVEQLIYERSYVVRALAAALPERPDAPSPALLPALGVSVYLDPHKYLTRLMDSIDFPVASIVIVAQGLDHSALDQLPALSTRENVSIVRYPVQIGCAGAWNEAIRLAPAAPFWFLVNNDVSFLPGQLAEMAAALSHRYEVDSLFVWHFFGYSCFAVTSRMVAAVGVFDENIYPAYYEDWDWWVRIKTYAHRLNLSAPHDPPPTELVIRDSRGVFMHGDRWSNASRVSGTAQAIEKPTFQSRSAVREYKRVASRSHNQRLFQQKWGCEENLHAAVQEGAVQGTTTFVHPHNDSRFDSNRLGFDGDRRRCTLDDARSPPNQTCEYNWELATPAAPLPPAPRYVYIDSSAQLGATLMGFEQSAAFPCRPSGWQVVAFEPLPPMHRYTQKLAELLNAGIPYREALGRLRWDEATEACMREAGQGVRPFGDCAPRIARWERAQTMPHAVPSWVAVGGALGYAADAVAAGEAVFFVVPAQASIKNASRDVVWSIEDYAASSRGAPRPATTPGAIFRDTKMLDILQWIDATWSERDYVYLRLGSGGHEILASLPERSVVRKIDELRVENLPGLHGGADGGAGEEQGHGEKVAELTRHLRDRLQSLGVFVNEGAR
jgi:hypothetical protein